MKKVLSIALAVLGLMSCKNSEQQVKEEVQEYLTPFELGNGNQTATYQETIEFYERLVDDFPNVEMDHVGQTDNGEPLHLISFSKQEIKWNKANEDRIKILINNGIHPGESDGIDASMILMRDLATGKLEAPDNLILSVIPVYNIGGALNRNSTTRTNQNGPEAYGFRGNARNYDLNRDFIKADSRNALAFYDIFHKVKPDIFIDNHVSNGADYQYTLTHLFTQHNKLGGAAGTYLHHNLQPALEKRLADRGLPITPYVNVHGAAPEKGFSQFMDHPRYSTGYTSLWNVMGMMVETHMLKAYEDRVKGTHAIMEEIITLGSTNTEAIKEARKASFDRLEKANYYPIKYTNDKSQADTLDFMGYEAVNSKSDLTDQELLTYDRNKPFTRKTVYHNYFKAADSVRIPDYYVVPRGQWEIIELMRHNHIQMELLPSDSTMMVSGYKIVSYDTSSKPYEGHYPHYDIELDEQEFELRFRESDVMIPTRQPGIRYILETLEPLAEDSYFKWNYFDTVLQQKEGFSAYVFESTAQKLLDDHPALQKKFDSLKQALPNFAKSNAAQLDWIHKHSPNYESAHLTYPIYKYQRP
ncbi:M14 family metallopeptidase [Nonlabens xiamenensis]|uniref:M14 family metallopeptidase n=1 Tax=Nonlabens xiamenensis TaxID=2341043 RepID=UPI000F60D68A|nr:M14 family metallopeptidase [Nonlabens xiamenensis]